MSEARERSRGGGLALALGWFLLAAAVAAASAFVLTRPPQHPRPLLVFSAAVPPEPLLSLSPLPALPVAPPDAAAAELAAGSQPRLAGLQSAPLPPPGVSDMSAPPLAAEGTSPDGEQPAATPAASVQAPPAPPGPQVAALPSLPEAPPAWQRFAVAFANPEGLPLVAVVVTGLGLSEAATEVAIRSLPPQVTLSFSPYARRLDEWIALARALGHEVLLDLPMEPDSFPRDDPGPNALLTSLGPQENRERLQWVLGRGSAYVGLTGVMGSRFVASEENLAPVLRDIADRGLIFVDNRPGDGLVVDLLARELELPLLVNDRTVDGHQASRPAIDSRLAEIERLALTHGRAIAIAHPYPVSLERLAEWTGSLPGRRIALAPVSALLP